MGHLGGQGGSSQVEHGIGRDADSRELLLDPPQAGLETATAFADLVERALEEFHPTAPVVPLLDAEQGRVDVDHAAHTASIGNQPFGRGETPLAATARAADV
jgi:hypothetical protein